MPGCITLLNPLSLAKNHNSSHTMNLARFGESRSVNQEALHFNIELSKDLMFTQLSHTYRVKRCLQGGVFVEVLKVLYAGISSKLQQLAVLCPNLIDAVAIVRNGELAAFSKIHLCLS